MIKGLILIGALFCHVSHSMETITPRLAVPRVAPVGKDERTPAQEAMLAIRPDYNIYKTLAHDPELYQRWSGLGQYLLNGSTLPARDREIIILRMGWLCQAPYEWAQHARIAKATANMSDAEIQRIAQSPDAAGWSDFERTLIHMADELRYETQIDDATWAALRSKYTVEQVIDALYTAGHAKMRLTLGLTGLLTNFQGGMFSVTEVAQPKPFPDVFLHAAKQLNAAASACVVIEDTPTGVQAGVAAGMTVFGFCAHTPKHRLLDAGAHHTFDNMSDLPRLLSGVTRGSRDPQDSDTSCRRS
ncbi:MAG TPA: HAD-IA family hydrolase [Steroidobacteraceae bacterium]|jgi:HAD superfamily hydrolase (TIGR01509 family)